MSNYRSLLAVDPSLTCSGWALFSIHDGRIVSVGKIKSEPPSRPMAERLRSLQERIESIFARLALGEADLMVCEAATTVRDPHNALKVETVRAMFESVARARLVGVPGRVNPRSVQFEVMGLSGKQLPRAEVKDVAIRTVEYLYPDDLRRFGFEQEGSLGRHQDIIDAILVGRLALSRIKSARDGGCSLEEMFGHSERQRRGAWRVRAGGC